jgi:hypothetical protein
MRNVQKGQRAARGNGATAETNAHSSPPSVKLFALKAEQVWDWSRQLGLP